MPRRPQLAAKGNSRKRYSQLAIASYRCQARACRFVSSSRYDIMYRIDVSSVREGQVTGDLATSAALTTCGLVLARGGRAFASLPDFEVARGRSIAILGASGSGKSTALLALAGVRAPADGEVVVEDIALWRLPSAMRDRFRGRRIGLVFQSFHLINAVS